METKLPFFHDQKIRKKLAFFHDQKMTLLGTLPLRSKVLPLLFVTNRRGEGGEISNCHSDAFCSVLMYTNFTQFLQIHIIFFWYELIFVFGM
jgi:hypothetical protein